MNFIVEYFEYKKAERMLKKELINMGLTVVPVIQNKADTVHDLALLIKKIAESSKDANANEVFEILIKEACNLLETDAERLVEVVAYIAQMKPEEICKVLEHAAIKTSPAVKEKENK